MTFPQASSSWTSMCLSPALSPLLPSWDAGCPPNPVKPAAVEAGDGRSHFHHPLRGPMMEWGPQHPPPSVEPFPWLPGGSPSGFGAISGHCRSAQETCLWLTTDGTGPPDGKLKVRQGDGHAAGKDLGGSQRGPDVCRWDTLPVPSAH